MLDIVRGLVRPAVTAGLVGAFILAAFTDEVAAGALRDITIAIVAYWFGTRTG